MIGERIFFSTSSDIDERHGAAHPLPEVIAERKMIRVTEVGILLEKIECFLPCDRQQLAVGDQVCYLKFGKTALARPEEIARTPYFQVNFSNFESIGGFAHNL